MSEIVVDVNSYVTNWLLPLEMDLVIKISLKKDNGPTEVLHEVRIIPADHFIDLFTCGPDGDPIRRD